MKRRNRRENNGDEDIRVKRKKNNEDRNE